MKAGRARSRKKKIKWLESDPTCSLCGKEIEHTEDASWDHVIPLSKGGEDDLGNLALAHVWCNNEKGDLSPFVYRIFRFLNHHLFKVRPGRPSKRLGKDSKDSD